MPEDQRNYGDQRDCGCGCNNNNGGMLGGLFGRRGCGCGSNSEVLFFLIVFLLLFTDFGCCNN